MASNSEKKVSHELDSKFENGPDVRSTDDIHYQHDTTPHDVDPTHKGQENLIENRKIAIEAHQKAAAEIQSLCCSCREGGRAKLLGEGCGFRQGGCRHPQGQEPRDHRSCAQPCCQEGRS